MKVQKKVTVGGEYAKVGEDIRDGDLIKILDGGQIVTGDYGDRMVFKIETPNGEKNLTFNQTSMNNIIDAYGDDTDTWKDKNVKVYIIKQSIAGKLKNVCYLVGEGWEMLDDGTVVNKAPTQAPDNFTSKKESQTTDPDHVKYPEEEINPEDIPF